VLQRPDVLSALCTEIATAFAACQIDWVAGPTTGGIIIAFEVGRQMGLPTLYFESDGGARTLRRGQNIQPGQRVLLVDDVLTTGSSLLQVVALIREAGAIPVGVGILIDRSQTPPPFDAPIFSAYRVEAESYAADAIPDWLQAIPLTVPGTRAQSQSGPSA